MKVLRKRVGELWEAVEVENTLEALQREVDGYIETVGVFKDACLIVNEEGLLNDMHFNARVAGIFIFGTALLVGVDGAEFCDLADIDNYERWLNDGLKAT